MPALVRKADRSSVDYARLARSLNRWLKSTEKLRRHWAKLVEADPEDTVAFSRFEKLGNLGVRLANEVRQCASFEQKETEPLTAEQRAELLDAYVRAMPLEQLERYVAERRQESLDS